MCLVKATIDTMTSGFGFVVFWHPGCTYTEQKITVEPYKEQSQMIKARKNPFYKVTFQRHYCETLFIKH